MLTLSMDVLFHSWDAQIAPLAHRDAVGRGHPLHHIVPELQFLVSVVRFFETASGVIEGRLWLIW